MIEREGMPIMVYPFGHRLHLTHAHRRAVFQCLDGTGRPQRISGAKTNWFLAQFARLSASKSRKSCL
jgi:hypothetical protein